MPFDVDDPGHVTEHNRLEIDINTRAFATDINVTKAPYNATGNGVTDDRAAIQAAIDACVEGQAAYLPPGNYRIGSPLYVKRGRILKGSHFTRWPYQYSPRCRITPTSTFTGDAVIIIDDKESTGGDGTNDTDGSVLENFYVDGNSYKVGGTTDVAGILYRGLVRTHHVCRVGVLNSSGHGIETRGYTRADTVEYKPRGISFDTCVVYSAGNLADSTQDGFHFDSLTDCDMRSCLAVSNRRHGYYISAPGQWTMVSCKSVFNANGNGFRITGGDASLATGNGGMEMIGCETDRNYAEGLLNDSVGRSRLLVVGCEFRRDGANNEAGGGTFAGVSISGATSGSPACPTFLVGCSVAVDDNDANNGQHYPTTGFHFQHLTQAGVDACHIWGRTTSVSQGTGSTGGKLKYGTTNWAYTGVPTAKVVVTPTIA